MEIWKKVIKTFRRSPPLQITEQWTPEEHVVIAYCLVKNARKLKAFWGVPALRALVIRGLLRDEGGPVNDTTYIVPDKTWDLMQEHHSFILPKNIAVNPQAIVDLVECFREMARDACTDIEINNITYKPFAVAKSERVIFASEDSYKILRLNRMSKKAEEFRRKYNIWKSANPVFIE